MRLLWIASPSCNYVPVGHGGEGYNGGGWISAMQNRLALRKDIKLGIAFCMENQPQKVEQDGVSYYLIPNHQKKVKDKLLDFVHINDERRDEVVWPYYEEKLKEIIADFKPDLIHVFGSELYQSLVTRVAGGIPTVLHLQGLLSLYIYILLPPGVSKWTFVFSGRGGKGKFHNYQYLAYWKRSAYREKAILKAVSHAFGRTEWDKHGLTMLNPHAVYHHCGEMLRSVFYEKRERVIPERPVISTTISSPLYKGFDVILKVANILKNELNIDFVWHVYGNVSPRFMERLTKLKHDDLNIKLLGVASADTIHEGLLNSTLYFHSSYIENSPNSVGEAQLVGIPVVAGRVGGTDSMVEHGKTGFLYPITDPYMAAYYVKYLIENHDTNTMMGKAAREVALERHDPDVIMAEMLKTYEEILKNKP